MNNYDKKRYEALLHKKNVLLDGLGMVWCSGGCNGGVGRYNDIDITEDMVAAVERNTKRLREWFENHKHKGE